MSIEMVRRVRIDIFCFLFITIFSCAPLLPDRDRPVDFTDSGMKKISAIGMSFSQGWNDPQAGYDERPGMQTAFTYDYWLDSTEVTQKQYYEVTDERPVEAGSQYGVGDDYPVYRVSWFDAVLYCNARSRLKGFDTVYMYSGVKVLTNGTVYELIGLRYDMSRDGYRLPTEAEWEYAAREGSSAVQYSKAGDSVYAGYYAWYGENSSNKTHPVATLMPNIFGLYDMAGNVFEWTNDWKCQYMGEGIMNSLGALQPGNEFEKVIKGGSYNYSLMYLRPTHRSATYATMISSANEYVGFRCARGAIPKGSYIGTARSDFTPNAVTIMANGNDFRTFPGTPEAKLVFVNVTGKNRTLCCVDFSRGFPYVREYLDDRNVHHPTISPDGRYVAYCSRNEGQSGGSKVSIRSLDSLNSPIEQLGTDSAYIPRWGWYMDPRDIYIVYTNSAIQNDNFLWRSTETFIQAISDGKALGSPEEFISTGSYYGGLSAKKAQYAVTGYTRLMRRDCFSGIDTQLFVSPQNGKDREGSTQVCNVSISPDMGENVRCMFLDFGYPRTSTVTGCSYGIHEYLFISDMSGNITKVIHCPEGEQSWDGVEWSNQPQFGVSCGRNSADQAHAVYAIDLAAARSKSLVTGTELQQPYLWIGFLAPNPSNFSLDSIGRYNDPPSGGGAQADLATNILWFWKLCDTIEVAMIGSSQANGGFVPSKITGLAAFNLASVGADLLVQMNLIKHYLLPHSQKLKIICSSLDIGWLWYPEGDHPLGNMGWKIGVGKSVGYKYDSCHGFWEGDTSIDDVRDILKCLPIPMPEETLSLGWGASNSGGWGGDPALIQTSNLGWTGNDLDFRKNLASIRTVADSMRIRKVHWIVVNFPVSPHYRNSEAYALFGPSWKTARDILDSLQEISSTNGYFHLYDANGDGNHDYNDSDACDQNHLSLSGAEKLTGRVDSIIHAILP
jgi:uncharacterized protein (TIGR02171 family)